MIDPSNVTRFDRTQEELQEYLLFCIVVAGKTATTQARALERFLRSGPEGTPFGLLANLRVRDWYLNAHAGEGASRRAKDESMREAVEAARLGQYERITRAFWHLGDLYDDAINNRNSYKRHWILNLHNVQSGQLESIPGVGPKTARYFILHTQRNAQVAAIDTHLLKFLAAQGVSNVPRSTPTGKEYGRLEQEYLGICRRLDVNPAQFDLAIWRHYSEGYDHMRAA